MTVDVVEQVLGNNSQLKAEQIPHITNIILRGGQITLAILAMIGRTDCILTFIGSDKYQPVALDSQLPWERKALANLLRNDPAYTVSEFYDMQLRFTAPVFSGNIIPRTLKAPITFPFKTCDKTGEGGFGTVCKVTIPREHQTFALSTHYSVNDTQHQAQTSETDLYTLARKEIRRGPTGAYELELQNLSILGLVRHPHIVQLVGSYTYDNKDYFLFPWTEKDLETMLSQECPPELRSAYSMTHALCGLTSALSLVHNFTDGKFEAIGCHHDLKPSNILVDGAKFLLADFGLSRFKEASEGSNTTFRTVRGDYIAPECQNLKYPYENNEIHRSADIWALGCIVLELLVFMRDGRGERASFKERRKFTVDKITYRLFHNQEGRVAVVDEKINELRGLDPGPLQRLGQLVDSMLNVEFPGQRPKIADVDGSLRLILIRELTERIQKRFDDVHKISLDIGILLERGRFESWIWAAIDHQAKKTGGEKLFFQTLGYDQFQSALELLGQVEDILGNFIRDSLSIRHAISALRHFNERLLCLLPSDLRQVANLRSQCAVLQTEDSTLLDNIEAHSQSQSGPGDIAKLAAIRRVYMMVDQLTQHDSTGPCSLRIEPTELEDFSKISDNLMKGTYNQTASSKAVLVEWRHYFDRYPLETHPSNSDSLVEELVTRTKTITKLLRLAGESSAFCVLPSLGFYHNSGDQTVGLVYSLEALQLQAQKAVRVKTLRDILVAGSSPPMLERRFELAKSLAKTLLAFHKIKWLHKSISSANVIFPCFEEDTADDYMQSPYLVGFLSSRQASGLAFSDGPADQGKNPAMIYEHPDYLKKNDVQSRSSGSRFKQQYDYYSLGIVLLELGIWKVLRSKSGTPDDFLDWVLDKPLARLRQFMGSKYTEAVRTCLIGFEDEPISAEGTSKAMCFRFKEEVIDKIAQCTV
ncbi:hypothetical protein BJY04DRAFT_216967 [Aspergillus karnatakaensis]|uniref:protein kinase family protein n=1 Tax=Aspergillus karnatakaensis TaxID=1810916 RepID=UPI003CCDEFF1